MLSEVFWSFFLTSTIGCLLGIMKMLYKSKCKTVECCGMKVERDVEIEGKEDEIEMRNRSKNNIDL